MSKSAITDKMKMGAIVGHPRNQTPEEAQADVNSTTDEDYDLWILAALDSRTESKIQVDGTGKDVEHPTARMLRLGIESIKVGKPSSFFLEVLEALAEVADTHDVLSLCFPGDFPDAIAPGKMKAADTYLWIVEEYRAFVSANGKSGKSFSEVKGQFKKKMESESIPVSRKTVDRALKEHGLDWPAKGA
jgi:hypothetical protein